MSQFACLPYGIMDYRKVSVTPPRDPAEVDGRHHGPETSQFCLNMQKEDPEPMHTDMRIRSATQGLTENMHLRIHIQRARMLFHELSEKATA